MAVTDQEARVLTIVKTVFADSLILANGIATLSSGTIQLDTGLREVIGIWCMGIDLSDTESLSFNFQESTVPTTSGTVRVDATLHNEGVASANAASEQFSWIALGRA